jgi:hypothetical protein
LFTPQFSAAERGYYAEVFTPQGKLLFTSPIRVTREAAIAEAKKWQQEQRAKVEKKEVVKR